MACRAKSGPPFLIPLVQIYQNIWTPWIIYFNFVEIFGPPGAKFYDNNFPLYIAYSVIIVTLLAVLPLYHWPWIPYI